MSIKSFESYVFTRDNLEIISETGKDTVVIKDSGDIYSFITKQVGKQEMIKLQAFMKSYIARNNDFFSSNGLNFCPTFGQELYDTFISISNIDLLEFKQFVKTNGVLKQGFITVNDPVNLILLCASKVIPKEEIYRFFLLFKLYTSKYNKYFKYGVDAGGMEYVYNNVLTRQSLVVGNTISEVFSQTLRTADKHFAKELIRLNDIDILKYINSLSTRLNEMLKKISNKYYEVNSKVKIEKEVYTEEVHITTLNDTDIINSLIRAYKNSENNGVNIKTYELVDKNKKFRDEFYTLHVNRKDLFFYIAEELINLNIKKSNGMANFKKTFAANAFSGSLKSKVLTDYIEELMNDGRIKGKSDRAAFRTMVINYISLRIYRTYDEVN